jgi:putative oxidoreductase
VAPHLTYLRQQARRRARTRNIALWMVQIAAGAAFFVAGAAKLYGVPDMVGIFDRVGLGQWFRHMTGAIEFGSAVLLLYPGFATIGALLLAGTMAGAIAVHLAVIGGSALPAAILLGCCLFIAWGRKGDSVRFRRRAVRAY